MEKKPSKRDRTAKVTSIEKKLSEKKKQLSELEKEKKTMNTAKVKRLMSIVFAVLLVIVVIKGVFEIRSLKGQEKDAQIKLEEKLAEKEKLEQQKTYINSEEYIEQAARDMLKMIKPGEILYVLKNDAVLEEKETTQQETTDNEDSKND